MATMEYTREARCLDCKYYVPAPKPFAISMCGLKNKPTDRKKPCLRGLEIQILNTYSYGK